jgi:spore coat-associated protein N
VSPGADQALEPRQSAERPAGRNSVGLTVILILAALAIALGALVEAPDAKRETPRLDVVNQNGDVVISNSKEGLPIVSMTNMKPGDTATGEVTLENTGTARGHFYLAPLDLVSPTGPGGKSLAENLIIRVSLTKDGVTSRKYGGLLSKMGTRKAGNYRPGEAGTYTFEAIAKDTGIPAPPTLSRPIRGDNKYQGTWANVTLGWSPTP